MAIKTLLALVVVGCLMQAPSSIAEETGEVTPLCELAAIDQVNRLIATYHVGISVQTEAVMFPRQYVVIGVPDGSCVTKDPGLERNAVANDDIVVRGKGKTTFIFLKKYMSRKIAEDDARAWERSVGGVAIWGDEGYLALVAQYGGAATR